MSRVSVIIPAYNHERFVVECLDSVEKDDPNAEIVVIDDGSSDATGQQIGSWMDAHPAMRVIYRRQANAGLTTTLNRLLQLATGEYVTMLASDDRLLPGGIGRRIAFLEQNTQLHAVISDCRVIDESGGLIRERGIAEGNPRARLRLRDDTAAEIVEHFALPGPVLLYRRESVLALGGYTEGDLLEDWDLYLRLAARNWVGFIDDVVADYREHGTNTVRQVALRVPLAQELKATAFRRSGLFRGRLRVALWHEAATFGWVAARAERRWTAAISWRIASYAFKLVSLAIPRRPAHLAAPPPAAKPRDPS